MHVKGVPKFESPVYKKEKKKKLSNWEVDIKTCFRHYHVGLSLVFHVGLSLVFQD